MTAAEAAALAAKQSASDPRAPASASAQQSDDSPCTTDADCGLTRVGPSPQACCPMLCAPRVVTRRRAAELEKNIARCHAGGECPYPACRQPPREIAPSCQAGRCVGKSVGGSSRDD